MRLLGDGSVSLPPAPGGGGAEPHGRKACGARQTGQPGSVRLSPHCPAPCPPRPRARRGARSRTACGARPRGRGPDANTPLAAGAGRRRESWPREGPARARVAETPAPPARPARPGRMLRPAGSTRGGAQGARVLPAAEDKGRAVAPRPTRRTRGPGMSPRRRAGSALAPARSRGSEVSAKGTAPRPCPALPSGRLCPHPRAGRRRRRRSSRVPGVLRDRTRLRAGSAVGAPLRDAVAVRSGPRR